MKQNSFSYALLFLLIVVSAALSACRLKAPNAAEQRYLIEQGAFPAGVPPWVSRVAIQGGTVKRSTGFIPETLGMPAAVSRSAVASPEEIVEEPEPPLPPTKEEKEQAATIEASPLHRIAAACPNVEADASRAITITDVNERSKKLSALVNRCPQSADLWLWLGRAYAAQKKPAEAKQALERARSLDPQSAEIRSELEKLPTPSKK